MSDVVRRKWDVASPSSGPATSRALDAGRDRPKCIEARSGKVAFEAAVGKSALVQSGAGSQSQAGFYCSLCDRLCKDNVSYLDHLNSPFHLKNAGHKLEIKRATLSDVRARIAMHKRRKLEASEDYDLDKRVSLLKEQQALDKQARKDRKLAIKKIRQSATGAANRRALLRAAKVSEHVDHHGTDVFDDPFANVALSDASDVSEYSDYDIDEDGNIIETPLDKMKPKLRRVESISPISNALAIEENEQGNEDMVPLMGFNAFGTSQK